MAVTAVNGSNDDDLREKKTLALLDTGSNHTFCHKSLFKELNVEARREEIYLNVMGKAGLPTTVYVGALTIQPSDGSKPLFLSRVYAIDDMDIRGCFATQSDADNYPHLRRFCFPKDPDERVLILIGVDNHKAIRPTALSIGEENQPYGAKCRLGWTMVGPLATPIITRT